jgi:hypothetical protein
MHPSDELTAEGPRHSTDWYDPSAEAAQLGEHDRLFLPCIGGPSISRLEWYPPQLEVAEKGGTYVLVDDGPRAAWHYLFVPHDGP